MISFRHAVKIFLLLFVPASVFGQSNTQLEFAAPIRAVSKDSSGEKLPDRSKWKEIPSERKMFSSTYVTDDGEVIVHTGKSPLNYYNPNGELVPIDATLHGMPYRRALCADHQPYPTYFFEDGSAGVTVFPADQFIFGKHVLVNGQQASIPDASTVRPVNNQITFENVVPGLDKIFDYRENAVKFDYVLKQRPQNFSGDYVISEEMEVPNGCYFENNTEEGHAGAKGGWTGELFLKSADGQIVSQLKTILVFDANKNWTLGTYRIVNEKGVQRLQLEVDGAWLNDASRAYPVTIDPLVTGPVSLWTGGTMPSCISPNNNVDSILVTIPGQITVTGLMVTSSYYADPFTTATMSMGDMWFSTSCNTSQHFTIGGTAGNMPGTAYLDTFNLNNPLMCCFPQSCSQRTFWLTMHLARSGPGSGCNSTYIYYDPTSLWPFNAYIVGHTAEYYGQGFTVQSTPICSNQCTFSATVFVRYGVPPFVIFHPWGQNDTIGTPLGCSTNLHAVPLTLTNPNCPTYCNPSVQLMVGPPVVTDACGNTVAGLLQTPLTIKPTPQVNASPNPDTVCSGAQISVNMPPCLPNAVMTWTGNNTSGTGNISTTGYNSGNADTTVNFFVTPSLNGCTGPVDTVVAVIQPTPTAAFSWNPQPGIAGAPVNFTDQSQGGNASVWLWDFGDGNNSILQNAANTYNTPGTYTVCLFMQTDHGCMDSVCNDVQIVPALVIAPNVVTPNGDGKNDLLVFQYLDSYPDNHVEIFDRWGKKIFETDHYANNWDAGKYVDGTYYYVLTITSGKAQEYSGFFEVIK